jgi:glycosyltransferase involved in cell wall biosynthesis
MSAPLLTIIIATFNGAQTVQKTLDSILIQDFQEWEVIVVDGLSTDNTVDIIRENARRDRRVRFVSERDKGVYDAMNKGISLAGGDWIYFLGCDDWLVNRKVLNAVFNEPGMASFDFVYANVISTSYKGPYDGAFTLDKLLSRNISHQAIFHKKALFDRIGKYNLRYKAHADWDLNIRCFADGSIRKSYIDIVVAEFGADGISSQHDVPFLREVLIPERLRMLDRCGTGRLRSISAYDEWWRVIRNAGIRSQEQFDQLIPGVIPRCIRSMIRWQQRIPETRLRVGALSKSLMFVNYIANLLTGAI